MINVKFRNRFGIRHKITKQAAASPRKAPREAQSVTPKSVIRMQPRQ
jgi:hypothetical protein